MKKKILSAILATLMMTVMIPANISVSAEESANVVVREVVRGVASTWNWSFDDYGLMTLRRWNDTVGVIDKSGRIVVPFGNFDNIGSFSEGLAPVGKGGLYGFIDTAGNIVIPLGFDEAQEFSEGLAAVSKDGLWGFIDETGSVIIQFQFEWAGAFVGSSANVTKDGKWGVINRRGELAAPMTVPPADEADDTVAVSTVPSGFDWVDAFGDRGLFVAWKDGKGGIIDRTGEIIVPFGYYANIWNSLYGLAIVSNDRKWGAIDEMGELVVPLEFDWITTIDEDMISVQKGDRWGIMDMKGNFIVPLGEGGVSGMGEGMLRVERGGRWGVIDKAGAVVVPFEFDEIGWFNEGLAFVRSGGRWGVIDSTGKLVAPPTLELDWASSFSSGGLAVVWSGGRQGLVTAKGEIVIPFGEFSSIQHLMDDFVLVSKDNVLSIMRVIQMRDITVTFGATKYVLNGEPLDVQIMVYDGVAYLPAAYLAYRLDLTARWDKATDTTALTSKGTVSAEPPLVASADGAVPVTRTVSVWYDETRYYLDGGRFSEPSIVYGGVAYLPAAYLAQKLGLTAVWNAETNITTLSRSE